MDMINFVIGELQIDSSIYFPEGTMEVSCKAYASGSILSDDISCVWSTKTESKSAQGSIAASYALRSPPN
jgi:hypothetical protein